MSFLACLSQSLSLFTSPRANSPSHFALSYHHLTAILAKRALNCTARPLLASSSSTLPAVAASTPSAVRSLATVTDAPNRTHGGLKDQDRIFQNAYMRHDHLLKGAKVSPHSYFSLLKGLVKCQRRLPLINLISHFVSSYFFSVPWRLASNQRHSIKRSRLDHQSNESFRNERSWWSWFPFRFEMVFHEQTWLGEGW